MHSFIYVVAFLAIRASAILPNFVKDSDIDLINFGPYREDARQLVGSRIKVNYLASLVANPDDLGLPKPANMTEYLASMEVPVNDNPFDKENSDYGENGIMQAAKEALDYTNSRTIACTHGNVLVQYREKQLLPEDAGNDTIKTYSRTRNSEMVFTTKIGEETSRMAAEAKYPDLQNKLKPIISQQTCWPTHGFHLHTGSGDNAEVPFGTKYLKLAGFHLGPVCTHGEYFDLISRSCQRCEGGESPDWGSSLFIRKYDEAQFYDEKCGGAEAKMKNVSLQYLGSKEGPYFCRKLVEKIGYTNLHGGVGDSTQVDPNVVKCLHESCASDIDIEYGKIMPQESWNFKNLHMGNYNPLAPLNCIAPEENSYAPLRGDCGRCSFLTENCEHKSYQSGDLIEKDEETCQAKMQGSVPWGLHRINSKDYTYSIPAYDETKSLHLLPENLRFEGPDMSAYMSGATRQELQHQYCYHMNIERDCLPPGTVDRPPTPRTILPTVNLYVDEGSLEPPYYFFYTDEDCSGTPLENIGNDTYVLTSNRQYLFQRCHNASTHPFNVHAYGNDPNYIGITNATIRLVNTGGSAKVYEWYCSSHSEVMRGFFLSKEEHHSHRRLYELYGQTTAALTTASIQLNTASTQLDSPTENSASDQSILQTRTLSDPMRNAFTNLKPNRAPFVNPNSPKSILKQVQLKKDEKRLNLNVVSKKMSMNVSGKVILTHLVNERPVGDAKSLVDDAQDQGWDVGERIGGLEYFIEEANMTFQECAETVAELYPEANGASFDIYSFKCFANENSTSHNENNRFISILFPQKVAPAIGFHLPNGWQINKISKPATVSVAIGIPALDEDGDPIPDSYSAFAINGSGFVRGKTDWEKVEFYKLYHHVLHEDLGSIKSLHHSIEYLDGPDAMNRDAPTKSRREVIAIGANNVDQQGDKWASLHIVETSGFGTEKSICLEGFLNKNIREVHGIAVIPFTQDDDYRDIAINRTTLQKEEGSDGFKGSIDEAYLKYDNGMVIASITDQSETTKLWVTSYNGVPMDIGPTNPGSVFKGFDAKWSRYAIHRTQLGLDYLLMAVVEEETNTVYVWDGEISDEESFQIESDKGIVSTSAGSKYSEPPGYATFMPIRDLMWTQDEKLIVLTDANVYMYERIREDLPFALCQNQKRPAEISGEISPGFHWNLGHFCEIIPVQCEPGKYQDERGKQSCKTCSAGTFQPGEGSTGCYDCAQGRFQPLSGQTSCDECMPGFYTSAPGSPGLGPGEHTSIMLDYTCEKCPIGYFSIEKAAAKCQKCQSADHCDIESQIFPHADCTPDTDEWEANTDHIHQFCCSTDTYYDSYIPTYNLNPTWRLSSKLYCVNRRSIEQKNKIKDCGDLSAMINAALDRSVEDDLLDDIQTLDFDDFENMDLETVDRLINKIDTLYDPSIDQDTIDDVQHRANIDINYTVSLLENITQTYIKCQINNIGPLIENMAFAQVQSNITGLIESRTGLPASLMFKTEEFINQTLNQTFEQEFSKEKATCFATTDAPTIHPLIEQCCPNYIDTSPQLLDKGKLTIKPGDTVYCLDVYDNTFFPRSRYNPETREVLDGDPNISDEEGDLEESYLGCVVKVEPMSNFYATMPEIEQCCPTAMAEIRNQSWNEWDFENEPRAHARCYKNDEYGECYIQFTLHNESLTREIPVREFIEYDDECEDHNFTYVPEVIEVITQEDCLPGWDFVEFVNQKTLYTSDESCPEGYNESFGELEFVPIYEGTCADIGFEDVPLEDCYREPEDWKKYIDSNVYDKVEWTGTPRLVPTACTFGPLVEEKECTLRQIEGQGLTQECFVMNKRYTAEEMEEKFEYMINTTQICSEEFPCLCQRETTCMKLDTTCSAENECVCSLNATSCPYTPEYNITECECQSTIEEIYAGTGQWNSSHNPNITWELSEFWLAKDYDLVQGMSLNSQTVIVIKETFENVTADELPLGVARSTDKWNGFYDDKYLYNVRTYDTNEVLINMKGGIDFEATRGTDEFRYCRYEFDVISNEIREMTINVFNATSNETYLIRQNETVEVVNTDSIYCSSFFPIARQTDTGDWTCSSVRECPYWEYWPRPINEYGFVETDPCLCNGVKQYGGYCIPEREYLKDKKGPSLETQSKFTLKSDYFYIESGSCEMYNAEYIFDEEECTEAARSIFEKECESCPASNRYLEKWGTSDAYWCYSSKGNGGTPCKMSNSGIAPPSDGHWGANQADCSSVGRDCEFSSDGYNQKMDRPPGCYWYSPSDTVAFIEPYCSVKILNAKQSTIYDASRFPASNAIDGDDATFSHTQHISNSWIHFDIEPGHRSLAAVEITNRLDSCCHAKLAEFSIEWQKSGESSWNSCGTYTYTAAGTKDFACDVTSNTDIRAVRIRKHADEYLHLAEVKIFTKEAGCAPAKPLADQVAAISSTRRSFCKRSTKPSIASVSSSGFVVNNNKAIQAYTLGEQDVRPIYQLASLDAYCETPIKELSEGAFPARLNPGDALYSADGAQECMNRCHAQFPDARGFYLRHDGSHKDACRCTETCDAPISHTSRIIYDAYKIIMVKEQTKKGQAISSEPGDTTVISSDGNTMLVHGANSIKIYGFTDPNWSEQYEVTGNFVHQYKTSKTPFAISKDGNTVVAALNQGLAVYERSSSGWQEKGGSPIYEISAIGSYCGGEGKHLSPAFPARLSPGDSLYSADGAQECMNRCLDAHPDFRGFYTRNDGSYDDQCACARSCNTIGGTYYGYTSYRVHHGIPSQEPIAHVDVSDDGSVVAFSAGSYAFVYEWSNNAWQQRGDSLYIGDPVEVAVELTHDDPSNSAPDGKLGLCAGNCDTDSDCQSGLVCFQRNQKSTMLHPVPGCLGTPVNSDDYCIKPLSEAKSLNFFKDYDPSAHELYFDNDGNACTGSANGCSKNNMPLCYGDCDSDANCGAGLYCLEHPSPMRVAGCKDPRPSQGGADYCYDPTIYAPELIVGRVSLSGSGDSVVTTIPYDGIVQEFAWKSVKAKWSKRGVNIDANARNGFDRKDDVMVLCDDDIKLFKFKRRAWRLMATKAADSITGCSLSSDKSLLSVSSVGSVNIMTTSLEDDVLMPEEIWVSDLDVYFTQDSYHKYFRECSIGSIMKATSETNITDIAWWEDSYDRACMCQDSVCNAYNAHDLLVGLSADLDPSRLLTMTCASDGCIYDEIPAERWSVTEEFSRDCYGAVDEVCGVYSFGRYNDKMPFQPLFGVYDEDGDVTTGMFKCPFTNGQLRNNFESSEIDSEAIFFRDGDFDLAPNGKPLYCACSAEICHFNQYCKITADEIGFCGNTKGEIQKKVLDAAVLDQCIMVPDLILNLNLQEYLIHEPCVCNNKYCKKDQYCTAKGCRECVCGADEYEDLHMGISSCRAISDCDLGEYVSVLQTRYSDRECAQCVHGETYSPFLNAHKCEPCTVCGGDIITKCNITHNTVCALVCPDGQTDKAGKCMDICTNTEHEMPDGTCIPECDYGSYFDFDRCVQCPEGTYTAKKGNDILYEEDIDKICFPHDVCNFQTHFYSAWPNASFSGMCKRRYKGHCGIRILGNKTHDDECIQFRKVSPRQVNFAHALYYNDSALFKNIDNSYGDTYQQQTIKVMELLETNNAESGIADYETLGIVAKYIELDPNVEFSSEGGYIDTELNSKTRIYAHFSQNSANYYNFAQPFDLLNVPADVSHLYYSSSDNFQVIQEPFDCSEVETNKFFCVRLAADRSVDVFPPRVVLNGEETEVIYVGSQWQDSGATCHDYNDGDITSSIKVSGTVDDGTPGVYHIRYNCTDSSDNSRLIMRMIVVYPVDTDDPVITLNGTETMNHVKGTSFQDPGATCLDDTDGEITPHASGSVDTTDEGTYNIVYTCTDKYGNSQTKTRVVTVVPDTVNPVVTLVGDGIVNIVQGLDWQDPGATCVDNVDGYISSTISVSGSVDTSSVGQYSFTYTCTDYASNTASVQRTINVVADTIPPVITILGDTNSELDLYGQWVDPGAICTDNVDKALEISTTGVVDSNTQGEYTIVYSCTDSAGNTASSQRKVLVD